MSGRSRVRGQRPAVCRPARRADAPLLAGLERACFPEADRFPLRTWRRLLGRPSCVIRVLREGDHLAAALCGLFRRGSAVARIYSIAVHPEQRGRGLARQLIDGFARTARRRGCSVLSLEVRHANAPARALYERLGFVACGTLPRYYQDGSPGLRYRRAVAPPPAPGKA